MIKNKLESLSGSKFRAFKLGKLVNNSTFGGPNFLHATLDRDGVYYPQDRWTDKTTCLINKTKTLNGGKGVIEIYNGTTWVNSSAWWCP
jgi:hypothetical protein